MLIRADENLNYCEENITSPKGSQKEIACFSWTTASGEVIPVMFKMEDEEGIIQTFDKIHVTHSEKKRYAGTVSYEYQCSLIVNGLHLDVTLLYYPETCKWFLLQKGL